MFRCTHGSLLADAWPSRKHGTRNGPRQPTAAPSGEEEATCKEAAECVHVVHARKEGRCNEGVFAKRECGDQSDLGQDGTCVER